MQVEYAGCKKRKKFAGYGRTRIFAGDIDFRDCLKPSCIQRFTFIPVPDLIGDDLRIVQVSKAKIVNFTCDYTFLNPTLFETFSGCNLLL